MQGRVSNRNRSRASKAAWGILAQAVAAALVPGGARAATNFIWTGAAGDATWTTTGATGSPDNWVALNNGQSLAYPGGSANQTANAVLADTVFDNVTAYSVVIKPLPQSIAIPSNITLQSISLGDTEANKGIFTLSSNVTLGTVGTTITLNGTAGALDRLGPGTDALTGGSNIGNAYNGTSGVQTIISNVAVNASQAWTLNGTTGEVLLDGTLTAASGQAITKKGTAELEINKNNASTFLGQYIAQAGATLLDNNNALGPTTNGVQAGGATSTNSGSLLLNAGVTLANPVTVAAPSATATGVTVTLGSGAATAANSYWTGAVTLNYGVTLTSGAGGTTTFSGPIGGAAGNNLTTTGAGTITLSGQNTYAGNTTVSAGTLALSSTSNTNPIPQSTQITVASGATLDVTNVTGGFALNGGQTLAGNGTVLGSTTVPTNSTITAGTGATALSTVGTLPLGALNARGGTYAVKVDLANATPDPTGKGQSTVSPTAPPGVTSVSDELVVTGLLTTSAGSVVVTPVAVSGAPVPGPYSFVIADAQGLQNAHAFDSLVAQSIPSDAAGNQYELATQPDGTQGEELLLDVTAAAPEPTSLALAWAAAAPLLLGRHRRRRSRDPVSA